MAKVGRKANDYVTTAGDRIPGLIHQKDGRWRVLTTGVRFTADSECEALSRFHQLQGRRTVDVPSQTNMETDERGRVFFRSETRDELFWPWLREFIVANLPVIAQKTGLHGLNGLDLHAIPGKAIKLADLADLYYDKSGSRQNTRGHVRSAVKNLATSTHAVTLADLATPLLVTFRDQINSRLAPTGATAIFGKIKSALAFARREGLDAGQIDAALGRMKVLYAGKVTTDTKPNPIAPENFRKLLEVARSNWRAKLLIALNLALYLEDVAAMKWHDLDLGAGTFTGRRGKTDIIRVGVLWPETVAALKTLPKDTDSPYVFVSRTGTRYRSDSLHRRYAIIRDMAGIADRFSSIRDGAYTVAARSCDDRVSRMFAAHAAPGLMDNYVQRNPQLVKPAADAVHAHYAPFPTAVN